jgi:hypothetical protein
MRLVSEAIPAFPVLGGSGGLSTGVGVAVGVLTTRGVAEGVGVALGTLSTTEGVAVGTVGTVRGGVLVAVAVPVLVGVGAGPSSLG